MKIFISWSGERSKAVAELLRDWVKCVLQATKPWLSTKDIDRGALWFSEINDRLKEMAVGIICVTQENKNRPWILFEAGALAKGLSSSRVCPLLIDLKSSDLEDPLAQFNHTLPDRNGVWSLVQTLNRCLAESGAAALEEGTLKQVFETYWGQFETKFKNALERTKAEKPAEARPANDKLDEILDSTRALNRRIGDIERRIERPHPNIAVPSFASSGANAAATLSSPYIPEGISGVVPNLVGTELGNDTLNKIMAELVKSRMESRDASDLPTSP